MYRSSGLKIQNNIPKLKLLLIILIKLSSKKILKNIWSLFLILIWMVIYILDTLFQCQKLNFRLDIKSKEEKELYFLLVSIAQACLYKLQLIVWNQKSQTVKLDQFNQLLQWKKKKKRKRRRKRKKKKKKKRKKIRKEKVNQLMLKLKLLK